jgi:hypothetical protein
VIWGAHAARVLAMAPRHRELFLAAYPCDFAFYVDDPVSFIHRSNDIPVTTGFHMIYRKCDFIGHVFCLKEVAILQGFKSDCLRAFNRTLPHQSQPE